MSKRELGRVEVLFSRQHGQRSAQRAIHLSSRRDAARMVGPVLGKHLGGQGSRRAQGATTVALDLEPYGSRILIFFRHLAASRRDTSTCLRRSIRAPDGFVSL